MQRWQWRTSVESPWFYATWFCLFAAVALVAMERKYGERQAGIERRFQARSQAAGEGAPPADEAIAANYSTSESTIIRLRPLALIVVVLACVFGVLAVRAGAARESNAMFAEH